MAWLNGVYLLVPAVGGSTPPKQKLVQDPAFDAAMEKIAAQWGSEMLRWRDTVVVESPAVAAFIEASAPVAQRADHAFFERLFQTLESSPDYVNEPFPGPARILTGRQDHVCGYQAAWDLLEMYPRATFAVLDRGGHTLHIEQEALVAALVNEWLDRVEEYAES